MTAPPSPNVVPKIGREESSVSMSDIDFFSNGAAEELSLIPIIAEAPIRRSFGQTCTTEYKHRHR